MTTLGYTFLCNPALVLGVTIWKNRKQLPIFEIILENQLVDMV